MEYLFKSVSFRALSLKTKSTVPLRKYIFAKNGRMEGGGGGSCFFENFKLKKKTICLKYQLKNLRTLAL